MLDPSLRATLEQRLGDVQFARTLEASPTRTIKPSAAPDRAGVVFAVNIVLLPFAIAYALRRHAERGA